MAYGETAAECWSSRDLKSGKTHINICMQIQKRITTGSVVIEMSALAQKIAPRKIHIARRHQRAFVVGTDDDDQHSAGHAHPSHARWYEFERSKV